MVKAIRYRLSLLNGFPGSFLKSGLVTTCETGPGIATRRRTSSNADFLNVSSGSWDGKFMT